jgi:hypothetical protein
MFFHPLTLLGASPQSTKNYLLREQNSREKIVQQLFFSIYNFFFKRTVFGRTKNCIPQKNNIFLLKTSFKDSDFVKAGYPICKFY